MRAEAPENQDPIRAERSTCEKRSACDRRLPWLGVAIALAITTALRVRLLDVPLERDEGDYAYIAQLLLQGVPLYTEAYEMRMPGIFAAYALILTLFGHTQMGIHLGLCVINAGTTVLVFLIGRRLFDSTAGMVAAISYSALSLCPSLTGLSANAEHFVLFPALGGLLMLLRAQELRRGLDFGMSGMMLGIAVLMKQHGAFFAAFAGLYLLWCEVSRRSPNRAGAWTAMSMFCGGLLAPLVGTLLWIASAGNLASFWFWTVSYPFVYASGLTTDQVLRILDVMLPLVLGPTWPYWATAMVGALVLAYPQKTKCARLFVLGWLGASTLAVLPGFYFRPHYFLFMLPAISILCGIAASSVGKWSRLRTSHIRGIQIALVVLPLLHLGYAERSILFESDPTEASREIYGANPFPESIPIARYIEERTDPGDTIAILGSEPQIYFYARRRSASPYILTYDLMLPHAHAGEMQDEMIRQIEEKQPKFMVFVKITTSWLMQRDSDRRLLRWFEQYAQRHYQVVGIIEIGSGKDTRFYWGEEAANRAPQGRYWLAVFQRNP